MTITPGSKAFRILMAVVATISITIVSCSSPVQTPPPPPPGPSGPLFVINSPVEESSTAGTFFFSVQPLDASEVARVDFSAGAIDLGSDTTAADGFRVAISSGDHAAGPLELTATVTGTNGGVRSAMVTVENVPNPPSSATVASDGAVLGTARGSTLSIRPGDAVGAQVTFTEQTQAEVKAATGVDYEALEVTFLGAQEIDSSVAIGRPVMVSSADFARFVQGDRRS